MQEDKNIEITITTDGSVISRCAAMMAESEPWLTLGMDYAYCLKAFDGQCKEVYIAMQDEALAGFVILQTCGSFKGYIQTLFVNAGLRGHGIGKILLQFCEKRILAVSPNIFICVSSFNKGAIKLYEEFGFTHVGMLSNFIKPGFDELLLRKTVGPIAGYAPTNTESQS